MNEVTKGMPDFREAKEPAAIDSPASAPSAGGAIPYDLNVSHSDDGQYLLLYTGKKLLAIYGAMGADPEFVEFADGSRFAVDALLDLVATG
ncbi:MAG: hypothetical protein NTY05_13440 [Rhodocyclales bacterium]|nr:hypothetical protein [Rhodocyclales bacterium]